MKIPANDKVRIGRAVNFIAFLQCSDQDDFFA